MAAKLFDPTLKVMVECGPEDWPVLTGQQCAPTILVDADIATVSGAADKVLRVQAATPYLLHLEFHAGHDAVDLPRLLHLRNTLLEYRHRLLVRTVAVILRPEADSPVLNGTWSSGFPNEPPYDVFRYQAIRAWELSPSALLAGGPGTLPLAPISAVTEGELTGIIDQMKRRLRHHARELWAATFILMGLRYSETVAQQLLRGVVSMEESVTYQAILREGREKGIQEGRQEGAVAQARKLLLRLGQDSLGPPDKRKRAVIESLNDPLQLEDLCLRLRDVSSWRELLEPLTSRRKSGERRRTS
jgi:predicted transposase YdaD